MHKNFKKYVSALATSVSLAKTGKENNVLKKVLCIQYLVWFKKNEIQALIDWGSEVNAMTLVFASKLSLEICSINIKAQKIDTFNITIFGIALVSFWVEDKRSRSQFFQKFFLLANISMEKVLDMFFLTFSKVKIQFVQKKLI